MVDYSEPGIKMKVDLSKRKLVKIKRFVWRHYDTAFARPTVVRTFRAEDGTEYTFKQIEYQSRRYVKIYVSKVGSKPPEMKSRQIYLPLPHAAEITDILKSFLPSYVEVPSLEPQTAYVIVASERTEMFRVFADMMFDHLADAIKFSPNSNVAKNWRINKITFDASCFVIRHDVYSFKKVLALQAIGGWDSERQKWRKLRPAQNLGGEKSC